jgi:hypothetical protein
MAIPIVGEKEIIGHRNPKRVVECSFCESPQKVGDLVKKGGMCLNCETPLCAYCGCSEMRGCVHEDFPNGEYTCGWQAQGVCSFCHYIIAEEMYLIATKRESVVRERYPEPPLIALPG